jgi:uncharacterized protein YbjT (DUF2867 family)
MRILLTGASGFVGSMLAPRLLAEGHELRALAREPARVKDAVGEAGEIEVVRGDVLTGEGLKRALEGIETAYYLIHSMESPPCGGPPHGAPPHDAQPRGAPTRGVPPRGAPPRGSFPEREREGARNFAEQARRAGVERTVYLGGLMPRNGHPSRHLASRAEVERILFEHVPGSVALRASILIGARSSSFRLLVRLVERLPVLTLPRWRRFRTQPIDARDAVEMLVAAAVHPGTAGRSLDIGGPEAVTYEELLRRIAELMVVGRPTVGLSITMTPLVARLAAAFTGGDPELILPLMEGLEGDLLPAEESNAADLFDVELHTLDDAIECALREWEAVEPLAAR